MKTSGSQRDYSVVRRAAHLDRALFPPRGMMFLLVFTLLVAWTNRAAHAFSFSQGGGDTKISWNSKIASSTEPIAHDLSELIGHVREVYGDDFADRLSDDVLGNDPNIKVGELVHPSLPWGVHDANTILINTRGFAGEPRRDQDAFFFAMVLAHEYEHADRAREADEERDPEVQGDCGPCEHSRMYYDLIVRISETKCDGAEPEERLSICRAILNSYEPGEASFAACPKTAPPDCEDALKAAAAARAVAQDVLSSCCPW